MNREIKFRGWDKEQSKMLTHEEIDELDKGGIAHWMDIIKPNNMEGVDVMQYTGMKDKNGKEIYEGDLCKVCINTGGISDRKKGFMDGVVEYEYGKYQINPYKYTGDIISVMGEGKIYGKTKVELRNPETIEVIGNIYETPELLNSVLNVQGGGTTDVK